MSSSRADFAALDAKGFVRTGADVASSRSQVAAWPLARSPMLLETSLPHVFAVGDVRSASIERVASAVGEGSICIQLVHLALAENRRGAQSSVTSVR